MKTTHKNKTLASLLSFSLGSLGAHRFYLYGKNDSFAWLHFLSLPLSYLFAKLYFNLNPFITYAPWLISLLAALITTLVLGLKADDKWDAQFNPETNTPSDTGWPIAVILVLDLAAGAVVLIGIMARAFDLLYTGGAYG